MLVVLLCVVVFDRVSAPDIEKMQSQNTALMIKINRLERILEKNTGYHGKMSAAQLLDIGKKLILIEELKKASVYLEILLYEYPETNEAKEASDVLARIENKQLTSTNAENDLVNRVLISIDKKAERNTSFGYVGLTAGGGGVADGSSMALELGRIKGNILYGAGGCWMQTDELDNTSFIVSAPPPGLTALGDKNLSDEFELFGVFGRRFKKRWFWAATLGISRQDKISVSRDNATGNLYESGETTENNITVSAQARYLFQSDMTAIFGYHNRRGVIGGISIKW